MKVNPGGTMALVLSHEYFLISADSVLGGEAFQVCSVIKIILGCAVRYKLD